MEEVERAQLMEFLYYGDAMYFIYKGSKIFVETNYHSANDVHVVDVLDVFNDGQEYVEKYYFEDPDPEVTRTNFLKAKLFDGKNINEVFKEVTWVDE
ncbi:MAG: hypothetical protein LBT80_06790 [Lactobacillaceae bacterium]|jgi:hypothetical protein|nr:hypothetical protein [Lactobacillaceae bacterium]